MWLTACKHWRRLKKCFGAYIAKGPFFFCVCLFFFNGWKGAISVNSTQWGSIKNFVDGKRATLSCKPIQPFFKLKQKDRSGFQVWFFPSHKTWQGDTTACKYCRRPKRSARMMLKKRFLPEFQGPGGAGVRTRRMSFDGHVMMLRF